MALLLLGALTGQADATGAGGWDHLGGTAALPALNAAVSALNADRPGALYAGGAFTAAGGVAGADRIAKWNGAAWSAVTPPEVRLSNGAVDAIAYDSVTGRLIVGGTFTNAGGNPNADFLAEWTGSAWTQVCNRVSGTGAPVTATVYALKIIGRTLYVGGAFADGAGLTSADRLMACNLDTGAAGATIVDPAHEFTGTVYALTADSNGTLYAGGGFTDLEGNPAADNVAYRDGSGWHEMGPGAGTCSCAVDTFVRSLAAVGTDVYVGTDATNVAGIAKADHVARWDGAWHAVGSNAAGTDGWFPATATITGLTHVGTTIYAAGSFQNAGGDPRADKIASFSGSAWHAVGSDGAGNGPLLGSGDVAVAPFGGRVVAGGNFTSAGGDTQAKYVATYPGAYTLTVSRTGSGSGAVSIDGTTCSYVCSYSYAPGTVLNLGVLTGIESRFAGWTGACGGAGACQITMDGNKGVIAVFTGLPACSSIGGYTATAGIAKRLQLECRDTNGNAITYGIVSGPSHGTLGPVAADGGVTYTPASGYSGPDQFSYNGSAADGVARTEFVSITVSDPGFSRAAAHLGLALARLRPSATGRLSLRARNRNAFSVRAISIKLTQPRPHRGALTFLQSSKAVTIKPGRTVALKGRLKRSRLAALKRLGHVRVRVRVVLKAPDGSQSTLTKKATLRAPRSHT
ncbi:MAG: Ig-like domain-containing protein [Solirubrobacteraceae bacterium]